MAENSNVLDQILNIAEDSFNSVLAQGGNVTEALTVASDRALEYVFSLGLVEEEAGTLFTAAKEALILNLLKNNELEGVHTPEVDLLRMEIEAHDAAHELFGQLQAGGTAYLEAVESSVELACKMATDLGFNPLQIEGLAQKVRESFVRIAMDANEVTDGDPIGTVLAEWDAEKDEERADDEDLPGNINNYPQYISGEAEGFSGVVPAGIDQGGDGLADVPVFDSTLPKLAGPHGPEKDDRSPTGPHVIAPVVDPDGPVLVTPPEDVPQVISPEKAVASVVALQASVREGDDDGGQVLQFVVSRSNAIGDSSVNWQVGGDVSGGDFGGVDLPSGTVHFVDGELSKIITVTVVDDYLIEGDETLTVTLSGPGTNLFLGSTVTANTIIHDDEVGYQVTADSGGLVEGAAGETVMATFTVTRSVGIGTAAVINFRAISYGGSPVSLTDFVSGQDGLADNDGMPSGTVSFAEGEVTKTIRLELAGDNASGPNEGFAVVLSEPPAGTQILTDTAVMKVLNDDSLVSISVVDAMQDEGSSSSSSVFQFVVTRTGSLLSATDVDYAVAPFGESQIQDSDLAGGAFSTGTVSFAVGQSKATVTINIAGDSLLEGNEEFEVSLLNPGGNLTIQNGTAVATIRQDDAAIKIEAVDAIRLEGNGTTQGHTFEIVRSGNLDQTTIVNWTVQGEGSSSASLEDFGSVFPSGSVVFSAGETVKIITVTPLADVDYESAETYEVVISLPGSGAVLLNSSAQGIILNDEAGFSVSATNLSLIEGHTGTTSFSFTVYRSDITDSEVSVDWTLSPTDINGVQASDFAGAIFPSGRVTFAPGVSSKIVSFEVVADSTIEGDENFTITLSNASSGADIVVADVAGTIYNDDAGFSIEVVDAVTAEGQSGETFITFTITRTGNTGSTATVAYSVAGSGINGADAADFGGGLPSGAVVFNPSETTKTLTVAVSGDVQLEGDEEFTVTLQTPGEGSQIVAGKESASAIIADDDDLFSVESVATTSLEGGAIGGKVVFNITRTGSLETSSTVEWSIAGRGDVAVDADDFSAVSGVVTFAPGESSRQIEVQITGDFKVEGDEGFTVSLGNASLGSTLGVASIDGTIVNDDVGLAVSSATPDLLEGDSGDRLHTFTIVRTGVLTGMTTVDWAVTGADGESVDANDFGGDFPTGTVSFASGETSKDIQFLSSGDTEIELNENFVVTLSNADGNADIYVVAAAGSITADDIGIAIVAEQSAVTEGGVSGTQILQFTVTRTGALAGPVAIDWAAAGLDVDDFAAGTVLSGRLNFGENETSKVISLTLKGDAVKEADETLTVTLTNPHDNPGFGHTSIVTDTAQTLVVNDDAAVSIVAVSSSQDEGEPADNTQTAFTFIVTRSGDTSIASSLDWQVQVGGEGDYASVSDFAAGQNGRSISSGLPSGTVTFDVGQTTAQVTVLVATDDRVEKDELFDVVLINPDEQTEISGSSATVTIVNDDTGFSIAAVSAENNEADTGETDFVFTVTRAGDLSLAATVVWVVTGSGVHAADAADFSGSLPSGTISFDVGESSKTLVIPVSGDTDTETDEEFTVTLSNALVGGDSKDVVDVTAVGDILNDDQEFAVSAANPSIAESSVGTTQIGFSVTRSGDLSSSATIDYVVTGTDGAGISDITGASLPSGTLTFAEGEDQLSVVFDVIGDTLVENDETFTLTLSNQSAGAIATDTASTVILNDDANYALAAPVAAAEGGGGATPFTFTVTRSGDTSSTGSVDWKVSGATGLTSGDFIGDQDALAVNSGLPSGIVNFGIGESSRVITINVQGDIDLEEDETLEVVLSSPVNGTITTGTGSVTILSDDDSFSISTSTMTRPEGNTDSTLTYTVTRTGTLDGARELTWTITGSDGFDPATDLTDGQLTTNTIHFLDGQTTADIVINVKGDSVFESAEEITVTLSGAPANTALGTASASTILTNDDASVSIASLQATKNEGNSSLITSGEVPQDTTSGFSVSSEGVVVGEIGDFTEWGEGQDWYLVHLIAGHTYQVDLEGSPSDKGTLDDCCFYGLFDSDGRSLGHSNDNNGANHNSQSIFVAPSTGEYYLAAGSSGDIKGTYTLSIADQTVPGTDVSVPVVPFVPYTFSITRSGNLDQESTVDWRVGGGINSVTADDFLGGVDELGGNGGLPSGTVTFAPGESNITVSISVVGDAIVENDEVLQVTLSDASTGTEIGTAVASGLVVNDDAELNITAGTPSLVEGDNGYGTGVAYTYTVTRTGNLDQVTTVDWAVVHGTTDSADFSNGSSTQLTPSGTLTFASGIATQTITVYGYGDSGVGSVEADETFNVELSDANSGSSIGANGSFESQIVDDDTLLTLSVDDYSKAEAQAGESTTYTYTVTRSGDLNKVTDFTWSVGPVDPATNSVVRVLDLLDSRYEYDRANGQDFSGNVMPTGNGSFSAGESVKTFTVTLSGDDGIENDEWFVTSITATNGSDQINVVYDNPDTPDGTALIRVYMQNDICDNQERTDTNYLYTSIERDEAVFRVLNREVQAEGNHTLLSKHFEGDTVADGGSDDLVAHIFAVQRGITTSGHASVDWQAISKFRATVDDFADGSDVRETGALASGTVTFKDGQEWGYITIYTKPDDTGEFDEIFSVFLENPSPGSSVDSNDTADWDDNIGYITNDDTRFDAFVNDVTEGGTLTYTVTRQGDSRGTDTVDWALAFRGAEVTNEGNNDSTLWYKLDPNDVNDPHPENGVASYDADTATWSGTLTFADGETSKTITVVTVDDDFSETWREDLSIHLTNPQNIDAGEVDQDLETPAIGSIDTAHVYDNEPSSLITLSVDQTELFEGTAADATYSSGNNGNTLTFTISRSAQHGAALDYSSTIAWSFSDSELNRGSVADVANYDGYNAKFAQLGWTSGNVYFASGETEKKITITFNGDNYVERDENFTFRLLEAKGAETWQYDVYGDDAADQNGYGPANIDISTGNHYLEQQITLKNDDIRLWIGGWDISSSDDYETNLNVEGYEGNDLTFDMIRAGRTDVAITIGYTITNGTTTNGDFTSTSGTFTLEALDASYSNDAIQTVTLKDFFVNDATVEADENFTITLNTPVDETGVAVRFQSNAINNTAWSGGYSGISTSIELAGTLKDDDISYTLTPQTTSLGENDEGADQTFSFTLDRTGTGYSGPVTVYWRVEAVGENPADGSDFSTGDSLGNNGGLPSGSVSFADGDLSEQFSVLVNGDLIDENNESFRVVVYKDILTDPNPEINNPHSIATAKLTIINDDNSLAIGDAALTESDSEQVLTFTVTRSGDTSVISTAHWTLAYASALAADFSGDTFGELTFNVGETTKTIDITVVGDIIPEDVENFTIQLSNFVEIDNLIDIEAEGVIGNDDATFALSAGPDLAEGGSQIFTVTRSHSTVQDQVINWTVATDTADAADFGGSLPTGSLTFLPGELSKTFTVTSNGDTAAETDEDYTVTISLGAGTTGDTITTHTQTGTIINDDAVFNIVVDQSEALEDHSGETTFTFTISRSGDTSGTGSVEWRLSSDTASIEDFSGVDQLVDNDGLPSGKVTFTDGQVSQTITINVVGDLDVETDELFTVTLSAGVNGAVLTATADATIVNDDSSVVISAVDAVKAEGDDGTVTYTFNVHRTGYLGEAETVSYQVTGSGDNPANGDDFGGALPNGTLLLPADQADTLLVITVSGDDLAELDENFQVTLSEPSTGLTIATASATGTIEADDIVFAVSCVADQVEGDPGDSNYIDFVVTRSGDLSGLQTLNWSISGVSAAPTDASDFVATSGTVTFNSTDTSQTIRVQLQGDFDGEVHEGFRLTLSGPADVVFANNTADALILDDDASLRLSATNAVHQEGGVGDVTTFTFTVERTGNSLLEVDVDWSVDPDGAVDVDDFVGDDFPGGSLHFAANETTKTITVSIAGDILIEQNEAFSVHLSNASIGADIIVGRATGTIMSDDVAWQVAPGTLPAVEGDGVNEYVYTVTRTGSEAATTIMWSVAGAGVSLATADDFVGNVFPGGSLVFAQGVMSQQIRIQVKGDSDFEADEDFTLTLSAPEDGLTHSFTQKNVTTTIVNDDDVFALSVGDIDGLDSLEGTDAVSTFFFTVTRSGSLSGESSVDWQIVDGGTNSADFITTSGTISFVDGQDKATVTVSVVGDRDVEDDEGFTVVLNNASAGSSIDPAADSAAGLIRTDDVDLTLSVINSTTVEGDLSGGQIQYLITRTGDLTREVSTKWALSGDVDAADFSGPVSGTVVFAEGESQKFITLNIAPDGENEGNEDFTLHLYDPSVGVDLVDSGLAGHILNDDDCLTITAVDADKDEGDAGITPFTFAITRSGSFAGTATVTWTVVGSGLHAGDNADFAQMTSTVTFADGEMSKIITVPIRGDNTGEYDEGFTVTLSDAGFGSTIIGSSASGIIQNDDAALFITADQVDKLEGATGDSTIFTFTITRDGGLDAPSSVKWKVVTTDGDSVQAIDFGGYFPSGEVSFSVGQSTQQISISIKGDFDGEKDESFQVVLSDPTNADIIVGTASTTILNDDSALTISSSNPGRPEGNTGETVVFTFVVDRIGPPDGEVTVDWRVSGNGTCWADVADFLTGQDLLGNGGLPSGSLVLSDGVLSQTIEITVVGDNVPGNGEGFTVTLENPEGATLVNDAVDAMIENDDSQFSISADNVELNEGSLGQLTTFEFTIARVGYVDSDSSVSWRLVGEGDNPADADDFEGGVLPSGTLTFLSGESSQKLSINVAGDYYIESQEGFHVEIYDPAANATVNSAGSVARANIVNDDIGTTEDDTLIGTAGADELTGLAGSDTLTGGDGVDRFRYTSAEEGTDHVTDFEVGKDKLAFDIGSFGTLGTTGPLVVADAQGFNTDVETTLRELAAQADADYYRVDFASGNFTLGFGDDGNLDELEAAFTESGTHSGSAIIVVSNGDTTTHVFFDEDTASGVDGKGLKEIAILDNVADATTMTDTNIDVQVA